MGERCEFPLDTRVDTHTVLTRNVIEPHRTEVASCKIKNQSTWTPTLWPVSGRRLMVLGAGPSNGKMVLKKNPLEMISKKVCCLAIPILHTKCILIDYCSKCLSHSGLKYIKTMCVLTGDCNKCLSHSGLK